MTTRVEFDSGKKFETPAEATAEIVKLNEKIEELEAAIEIINDRIEEIAVMRRQMGAAVGFVRLVARGR